MVLKLQFMEVYHATSAVYIKGFLNLENRILFNPICLYISN